GGEAVLGDLTGPLSDQGDLQAALDAKADTSSLADVATSGDYAALSDRPVVRHGGDIALRLGAEALAWPAGSHNGQIRLSDPHPDSINRFYGLLAAPATLGFQVDENGSFVFYGATEDDHPVELFRIDFDGGLTAQGPLHMSGQQVDGVA